MSQSATDRSRQIGVRPESARERYGTASTASTGVPPCPVPGGTDLGGTDTTAGKSVACRQGGHVRHTRATEPQMTVYTVRR